ncbi:MAG: hypothetical protein IPK16_24765 [Anaerolineales bacterium]|nr:hypothetical protein [Anaerolineales bacterium]
MPNSLSGKPYQGPLLGAGKSLAQQYLGATTKPVHRTAAVNNKWWVEAGAPVIVIERNAVEGWEAGAEALETFAASGDLPGVEFRRLRHAERTLNLWDCVAPQWGALTEPEVKLRRDALRAMRIALLRIHAERECLLNVVRNYEQQRVVVESRSAPTRSSRRIGAMRRGACWKPKRRRTCRSWRWQVGMTTC